jgi:hypothetical protein
MKVFELVVWMQIGLTGAIDPLELEGWQASDPLVGVVVVSFKTYHIAFLVGGRRT